MSFGEGSLKAAAPAVGADPLDFVATRASLHRQEHAQDPRAGTFSES